MKTSIREKVLILIGVTWIVGGAVAFLPVRNFLLYQLGPISPRHRELVLIVMGSVVFILVCWGLTTITYRRTDLVANLNLLLVSIVIMSPLLMEITLRTGIAIGHPKFRTPGLYANVLSDDDYYKLRIVWGLDNIDKEMAESADLNEFQRSSSGLAYDPILGWAYKRTPQNPLGVIADTPYVLEAAEGSVLFYGDSFVGAGKLMADKIPQQLQSLLPGKTVYNFGVPGYGLDQIYLRFKQSHDLFKKPVVIIGILTVDLDRCIMKNRSRPKPYFLIKENELVLSGVPVETNNDSYLKKNPIGITSYFGAALVQFAEYLETGGNLMDSEHRRGEIERVSKSLIEGIVQEANANSLDLRFVIFVPASGGGWRKAFLIREIERWGIPYLDTEPVLIESMAKPKPGDFASLYYEESGHHNKLANGIIAKAIAEHFFKHPRQ